MSAVIQIAISLIPVLTFLCALLFLDSFKLTPGRAVLKTIAVGCCAALVCLVINRQLLSSLAISSAVYSRYVAPPVEELLKGIYVVFLLKRRQVGFLVDAAIYGFAVGAGFALVENVHYLLNLPNANLLLWVIRGFGTAAMHSATMAIFAIISKSLTERHESERLVLFLPGMGAAILIHSGFNHFLLSPLLTTLILLVILPALLVLVFDRSEHATREWLGSGLDADVELLETIVGGQIAETNIGRYLELLRNRFPAETVVDMFCLLRIHMELALRAKGILMAREAGLKLPPDPEAADRFTELKHLESNIGRTGKLAILPCLQRSSRDLWQIYVR